MLYSEKRDCKFDTDEVCEFGTDGICELSGDRTNKRNCIPEIRYPRALKQWRTVNPERNTN